MNHTKNMVYKPSQEADELYLYTVNDGRIYNRYTRPIIENLKKKAARGIFNAEKATDAFYHVITEAARMYEKEFGNRFTVTERFTAAADMVSRYTEDILEA